MQKENQKTGFILALFRAFRAFRETLASFAALTSMLL